MSTGKQTLTKAKDPTVDTSDKHPLVSLKTFAQLAENQVPTKKTSVGLSDASLYINREISLLAFNRRVLAQAKDPNTPLLERLKFLAICSSNLDEFFEIRVAGLKRKHALNRYSIKSDRLSCPELLAQIIVLARNIVNEQYSILYKDLIPKLKEHDIHFIDGKFWNPAQAEWIKDYFINEMMPVLSPIALDLAHPFPRMVNKSLNFIFSLKGKDAFGRDSGLAVMQAPRTLPRILHLPKELSSDDKGDYFVFLSSIIDVHADKLFPGMKVKGCHQFRLTRNSDLFIENDTDDLASALQGELFERRYGDAVRLEVSNDCPNEMIEFLLRQFSLTEDELYRIDGLVNLSRLMGLYGSLKHPELLYAPFNVAASDPNRKSGDIFENIQKGDILLHHPFQSFDTVVDFLQQAAADPDVLAIRQTLYRTGNNSVLVKALIDAARSGKEVTAVIELRARFDEEDNIDLAKRLQEAGALVVYGVVGYKTHAKMILVVRREGRRLVRYVHLGTGNYHSGTARLYTDIGLLTCQEPFGEDVHKVFQQLTGMGKVRALKKLIQAPFTLHKTILSLIDEEIAHAKSGRKAHIILKINALSERTVMQKLYKASQAGVQIDLIIRGICCLKAGIKGVSENIRVRSIVGRFLEHSRVYYFENGGEPKIYCASADFLERNFFRRVEVCFPIEHPKVIKRVINECLLNYLEDNLQAWEMSEDGRYERHHLDEPPYSAQDTLLKQLAKL